MSKTRNTGDDTVVGKYILCKVTPNGEHYCLRRCALAGELTYTDLDEAADKAKDLISKDTGDSMYVVLEYGVAFRPAPRKVEQVSVVRRA